MSHNDLGHEQTRFQGLRVWAKHQPVRIIQERQKSQTIRTSLDWFSRAGPFEPWSQAKTCTFTGILFGVQGRLLLTLQQICGCVYVLQSNRKWPRHPCTGGFHSPTHAPYHFRWDSTMHAPQRCSTLVHHQESSTVADLRSQRRYCQQVKRRIRQ
jgi:hypothetical protein